MRIWQADTFGEATDVLRLVEHDAPEPGAGMLELQVEATGVGLPDALMIRGNYPAVSRPPVTPGQEIVGTVLRCGPDTSAQPGDRLISSTRFAEGMGGFAERCIVHEAATLSIPEGLTAAEAAGFFVPFHTGYAGVVVRGQLQPGETMLVLGGAGSSGSAAIQLGKAVGAEVIATVSSQEKVDFCRQLGADEVINYKETPIHEGIKALRGRKGVDVIFDPVGGSAYAQAVKGIARHGRVVLIGYSSGEWPTIDPLHAVLRSYSLVGAFPGAYNRDETLEHHRRLSEWAAAGKIRPPVDTVFPFEETPQAIARVAGNAAIGKVIVAGAT